MHHFRAISPKWVLAPQKKISCHIFKMAILTKFFDDLMNHLSREYAGKKMKLFLNVSPLTILNLFPKILIFWPRKMCNTSKKSLEKSSFYSEIIFEVLYLKKWKKKSFSCFSVLKILGFMSFEVNFLKIVGRN
jgi:hypothetical protein